MAYDFLKDRPKGTLTYTATTGSAYTIGMPVKLTNNIAVAAVGGDKVIGIAKTAKGAGTAGTIEVYPVRKSDIMVCDIGTGTMADSYVDTGTPVDFKSGAPTGLDITASSTDDVELIGWDGSDTSKAYGCFVNTVF